MEGRLVPLGFRQDDVTRDQPERESIKIDARYAVIDPALLRPRRRRASETVVTLGLIAASILVATAIRMALRPIFQDDRPFSVYMFAVILVSWRCGLKAGLLTTALGLGAGIGLFAGLESIQTAPGFTGMAMYLVVCLSVAAICGSLRSSRLQAEKAAAIAKEHQRRLEREIEARELAQDAAREANDQTRKLLDRITEAMITLDLDWDVVYANDNAVSLLKVAPDERLWDALEPSQRAPLRKRLQAIRETGLPETFEICLGASKQWIEYRAYPTPDGITLFARDVTEEKRTRTALEESEERYRAFLTQSSEAIWRFELEKPVPDDLSVEEQIDAFYSLAYLAECNETMARLYGFESTKEIVGKRLGDLLPREDPRNVEYLRAFIKSGYRVDEAESHEHDSSGQRHVFLNNLLGIQKDGYLLRAWGTQRDITVQKQAEAEVRKLNAELERRVEERTLELRSANKELEAFCYSVSHDLRAPLRSVMSQSVMFLEDYGPKIDEEGRGTLRRLANAAKNMAQLIDDLLALSRLQRTEMRKEQVDLSDMALAIAQELKSRGANVNFIIQPNLHAVADKGLLRVVMMNLIENATKFASKSESPKVEVGCCLIEEKTTYYVKDNGVGFDMKYVDKIFRPFERLHRTEDYPGTGIGLANVERVVERHGGSVWAEGKLGEGATFFFTL